MYLTLSALFVLAQDTSLVFSGRNRQLNVAIPRVDTTIAIDGDLSEPVWRRASRLTDFSQYQPVDGRPAAEPTEVLVWYASDAIYFGIRARGGSGSPIRATQANRDNIAAEDHVHHMGTHKGCLIVRAARYIMKQALHKSSPIIFGGAVGCHEAMNWWCRVTLVHWRSCRR